MNKRGAFFVYYTITGRRKRSSSHSTLSVSSNLGLCRQVQDQRHLSSPQISIREICPMIQFLNNSESAVPEPTLTRLMSAGKIFMHYPNSCKFLDIASSPE
jgi:hypothetical protein